MPCCPILVIKVDQVTLKKQDCPPKKITFCFSTVVSVNTQKTNVYIQVSKPSLGCSNYGHSNDVIIECQGLQGGVVGKNVWLNAEDYCLFSCFLLTVNIGFNHDCGHFLTVTKCYCNYCDTGPQTK